MSDDAFAPPVSSRTQAGAPLPGLIKGIAITAVVLGILGFGQAAIGIVALMSMDAVADFASASLPGSVRDEYDALMAAQMAYQPLTVVTTIASLVVSALMVAGGAVALGRRSLSLLAWAALGAAIIDVINVLAQVLVRAATNYEWEAYNQALSRVSGSSAGMAGGMFGMVVGLAFVIGFAVFWGYAFIRVREAELE